MTNSAARALLAAGGPAIPTTSDIEAALRREEIRALVTRLAVLGDRGRFAELATCFTEDGALDWATGSGRGWWC